MRDELLDYYRRELQYLKRQAAEYAMRYPGEAGRLAFDANGSSADPHVERLLQGVAFLNASIHRRIDDDYPRFTQGVLNALFPSLLQPVPAATTIELVPDPEMPLPAAGLHIERGTPLFSKMSSGGTLHSCEFRTCFDLKVYPVRLSSVKWLRARNTGAGTDFPTAFSVLRFTIESSSDAGLNLPEMKALRVHINGDHTWIGAFYELLATRVEAVIVRHPSGVRKPVFLGPETIQQVGFEPEEALSFGDVGIFNEHRLLQEYFAFREKFQYFDLDGIGEVLPRFESPSVDVEVVIAPFEPEDWHVTLEIAVTDAALRLNCSPAVNVFAHTQGVRLDRRRTEYLLNPGWSPRTGVMRVRPSP